MGLRLTLSTFLILGLGCHARTDDLGPTTPHQGTPGPTAPTNPDVGRRPQLPEPPQPPTHPGPVEPPPFEAPDTPPLLISSYQPSSDIFAFDPDFPEQMIRLTPEDPTQYGLREETSARIWWRPESPHHFELFDGYSRALFETLPGSEPRYIRSVNAEHPRSVLSNDGMREAWIQDGSLRIRDLIEPDHITTTSIPDSDLVGTYLYPWAADGFLALVPRAEGYEPWSLRPDRSPIALGALIPFLTFPQRFADGYAYTVNSPDESMLIILKPDGRVLRYAFNQYPNFRGEYSYQNKVLVTSYDELGSRVLIVNTEDGSTTELDRGLYGPDGDYSRYALLRGPGARNFILDMQTEQVQAASWTNVGNPIVLANPSHNRLVIGDYDLGGIEMINTPDGAFSGYWPSPAGWHPQEISDDGVWLHLWNSRLPEPNRSLLLNLETGEIQTPPGAIDRFSGDLAILYPNTNNQRVSVLRAGEPPRSLTEDLLGGHSLYPLHDAHQQLLISGDGLVRIIDPETEPPEVCRATLRGFDSYDRGGSTLWFAKWTPDGTEFAAVDTIESPCQVHRFTTSTRGASAPQPTWGSMVLRVDGTLKEATREGRLLDLDLPFGPLAYAIYVQSDPDVLWFQDNRDLYRVTRDLEVSYRATLPQDSYPWIQVSGQTAYVATQSWSAEPSLIAISTQGSTLAVQLPQEAASHMREALSGWSYLEPITDAQGRLITLTSRGVAAFAPNGAQTTLLDSELHPPIGLLLDGDAWYAPSEGGIWLSTPGEPQWISAPGAAGLRHVERLGSEYIMVQSFTSAYVVDLLTREVLYPPRDLYVSAHLRDRQFLARTMSQPVVWDQATGQMQPILPPSPATHHVRAVLP